MNLPFRVKPGDLASLFGGRRNYILAAWAAALLGGLAYGLLAYSHAHGQVSVLDEGLYLYKGLLFARGVYWPYQDFGPVTNHMPLSFLVPGWIQALAGPGLATGRAYAWVIGLLLILGIWLATHRLAGSWWAAAAVWLVALNGSWIKIYSQAISQGLIAAMLVWVVVLGVGEGRKTWQTTLAAALAGAMGLTRLNMLPVPLLLTPYIFWVHGRKPGVAALIASGGVLLAGHMVFWPGILKLWATWLPATLTPFLDSFRDHAGGIPAWQVLLPAETKLAILKQSLRLNLVSVAGVLWALSLVPSLRQHSPSTMHHLSAIVLLCSMFGVLLAFHLAATLGKTYCPYCLTNYLAFFSPIGLIVLAMTGAHWLPLAPRPRQASSLLILLLLPWALGFSLGKPLADDLLKIDVPRVSGGAVLPGTAQLGPMMTVKFGWLQDTLQSGLVGLQIVGLTLFLLGSILVLRHSLKQSDSYSSAAGAFRLLSVLAAFSIGVGTLGFGTAYHTYDCGQDVIASEEDVGTFLHNHLKPGAIIYWASGGLSPAPLLHVDGATVFPPQLDGLWAYRYGGDPEGLYRFAFWNPSLASTWLSQADYVLARPDDIQGWLGPRLKLDGYGQISKTPPTNPCDSDSSLLIFQRPPGRTKSQ